MQYGRNGFTPKKHSSLDANSKVGGPVKPHNFKSQHHHQSKTVIKTTKLKFSILRDLLLQNQQQQCHTIWSTPWKGKFSQISGNKQVNTANSVKKKADCFIGDPTSTVKVTLWENLSASVQDGKEWTFSSVRVLK